MSGRLLRFVHVTDGEGNVHAFGPDDVVPEWAVAQITNPKVWDGAGPPAAGPIPQQTVPRPPAAGPKATADAWRAYAVSLGLNVPEGAGRAEIIELVDRS